MFCKKCGYQIKEGLLFCPNCGEKAVGGAPNQHIEPKPQGKSLKKCAWYAPVSVIVALPLYVVFCWIAERLIYVARDYKIINGNSCLLLSILSNFLLILLLGIIIPLIFYNIATRKVKKEIKKQVRSTLVAPALFIIIPPLIYNVWLLTMYIITDTYYNVDAYYIFHSIFLIFGTIFSYFITAKYFEKAEKKIFSEMLQE